MVLTRSAARIVNSIVLRSGRHVARASPPRGRRQATQVSPPTPDVEAIPDIALPVDLAQVHLPMLVFVPNPAGPPIAFVHSGDQNSVDEDEAIEWLAWHAQAIADDEVAWGAAGFDMGIDATDPFYDGSYSISGDNETIVFPIDGLESEHDATSSEISHTILASSSSESTIYSEAIEFWTASAHSPVVYSVHSSEAITPELKTVSKRLSSEYPDSPPHAQDPWAEIDELINSVLSSSISSQEVDVVTMDTVAMARQAMVQARAESVDAEDSLAVRMEQDDIGENEFMDLVSSADQARERFRDAQVAYMQARHGAEEDSDSDSDAEADEQENAAQLDVCHTCSDPMCQGRKWH